MKTYDLIAACWTSAGSAQPVTDDERSPVPIRQRVEAVARAGFTGFGIRHVDLPAIKEGIGYRALRGIFDDNGIGIVELEYLEDWFAEGERRQQSDQRRAELLEAAEALGARHIKGAGSFHGEVFDAELLAPHLRELARQASDAGTRVGIEFTPYSNIDTPAKALELVEAAGHPAAGIFVDIWHVERGGVTLSELAALPARWILGVELDDADAEVRGTLIEDTVDNRRFLGEGDFDLAEFIGTMKGTGYDGPWGIEIISAEARAMSCEQATKHAFDTSLPFLEESR